MCYHLIEVREYLTEQGKSPVGEWFAGLDAAAAARITACLFRLGQGNFSNVKGIGGGLFEYRVDFGPGYRMYFGKVGNSEIILVAAGTKRGQSKDIKTAKLRWRTFRTSKRSKANRGS